MTFSRGDFKDLLDIYIYRKRILNKCFIEERTQEVLNGMRRQHATAPICVRVAGGALQSGGARATAAEALLHHVLFMRGQIPLPFRDLQASMDEFVRAEAAGALHQTLRSIKGRSHKRKMQRYVAELSAVCLGLRELCQSNTVESISFMFGASASAPREMVTLHFDSGGGAGADVEGVKRKIIREVIGALSDVPVINLPSTSLFVSVTVSALASSTPVVLSPDSLFSIRDHFRPALRKRGMPLLQVQLACPGQERGISDPIPIPPRADGLTFVLRRGIRGVSKATAEGAMFAN